VTSIKERLAAGETLFGSFLALGSPLAAEGLAHAGFDWLLVDLEHGGGHEAQALAQFIGVQNAGVHALARVESDARSRAGRLLDLGVEGLMCPQIGSAAQAEAWAQALHYPPRGNRGVALFNRGATYGADPDAIENARRTTLGIAQIESREAVADVEAIAAVDGIDVLFVGPSDLTTSMGKFRQFGDPEYRDAVARTVQAAEANGKTAGIFFGTAEPVAQALEDGFRMIGIGADATHMMAGAAAALATFKQ
jgi:2-keto-3-deoxy-L-rhamnonate aldolase RhmA